MMNERKEIVTGILEAIETYPEVLNMCIIRALDLQQKSFEMLEHYSKKSKYIYTKEAS